MEKEAIQALKLILKLIIKLSPIGQTIFVGKAVKKIIDNPWVSGIVHTGLTVGGMVPGIGWACDSANAVIYAAQGQWVNAGLSALSVVPGIGVSVVAAKSGKEVKGISGAFKLMSEVEKAEDATKLMQRAKVAEGFETSVDASRISSETINSVNKAYGAAKGADYTIAAGDLANMIHEDIIWTGELDEKSANELVAEGTFGSIAHGLEPLKLLMI